MNTKIWYEVYEIMLCGGTRTLEICDTIKEAKNKRKILKNGSYKGTSLHIDIWENLENPVKIGEVE